VNDSRERFTRLYDLHYRDVLRFAIVRAEREVAEDVTSEVFLVAWRRLPDIPDPAFPWLLGVARNLLLKQRDSRNRRVALVERIGALTDEQDHVTWDVAEHVVDRTTALEALGALSEADAEAIVLATWHGLTPDQAASVMGCSTRTYNVRLHRARKRLRAVLQAEARTSRQARPATTRRYAEEA
jgi:RNA polymerase sigma-70 factor (ECF subfamily)